MGTISDKLTYLNGTKQAIKTAINEDFEVIDNNTTFREYAEEISLNNIKYKDLIPRVSINGTNSINISNSAGLDKALVTQYGNTEQNDTPTPDTKQEILNISGMITINITDDNNHSKNYNLDLPNNIELCKIGTYKDKIYYNNGKWYLEKKIGKAVLDGSENITIINSGTSNWFYQINITSKILAMNIPASNFLCSHYQNVNISNNNTLQGFNLNSGSTTTNMRVRYGTQDTVQNYKSWLSNNNIIVYAPLATPTTTEITESNYPTLYEQLNNIKLYEGVNHITMTNESGLDVEFDIEYYKDWKLD